MTGRRLGGAAHVFVADLDAPVLDDADRHHLERVLRLRAGEPVGASDGAGGWRPCRFGAGARLEADGPLERDDRPEPTITVAFALTKGDKPEWVVQKLTEVGVDRIVPFVAARSVVRWDADKAARNAERLAKVAREAAMQSRRTWLPEVHAVATFAEVVRWPGAAVAVPGGAAPGLDRPTVLIGPEGGFDRDELGAARAAGASTVGLGPTVLRAETAALAAGVLLAAGRAGLVR